MKTIRITLDLVLLALAGAAFPISADEPGGPEFHAGDIQLEQLIATLLEENPQIDSDRARARSQLERVPQTRSLPDPQLRYRYFASPPETRVGPQEHALELSQAVPWKGKRRQETLRAEQSASGAEWDVRVLELQLVAELKRVYFEAAYLQEALTINGEERDLLRRFESIGLRRYATGEGIQQSVVKVQTDLTRLDDREIDLRSRLDAAVRRIAELIGRPGELLVMGSIVLDVPEVRLDGGLLERAAEASHPAVRAAEARIEAERSRSKGRRLQSRPDFTFGLGYTLVADREDLAGRLNPPEDNGQDILAAMVGINLPIHRKKIRAGIAESEELRRSNEARLRQTRNRLRYRIQDAEVRLESLGERRRLYDDVLLPQAEESLASAEAAYSTNRLAFLDLLDAERVLFQIRLTYHRLAADQWIALADLESAAGRPFPHSAAGGGDQDE